MGVRVIPPRKGRFIPELDGVEVVYTEECVCPLTPIEIEYLQGAVEYNEKRNSSWQRMVVSDTRIEAVLRFSGSVTNVYDLIIRTSDCPDYSNNSIFSHFPSEMFDI